MDALELLGHLGRVAPADQAVIDEALHKLTAARGEDRPRTSRRSLVIGTAAAMTAAAVAAGFLVTAGLHRPAPATAVAGRPSTRPANTRPSVAAVLTAFNARSDDVLMVTKALSGGEGEGPLGRTLIWIFPAAAAQGATVRTRFLNLKPDGSRLFDGVISYQASSARQKAAASGCDAIFTRPRAISPPGRGTPGMLTSVDYGQHSWARIPVVVQGVNAPVVSLRSCLTGGLWQVTGSGRLAGVKAIELTASDGYDHLWVNAATFLPIRLIFTGGPQVITFTFRFLPPTAANQAKLTVPIPAGFKKNNF